MSSLALAKKTPIKIDIWIAEINGKKVAWSQGSGIPEGVDQESSQMVSFEFRWPNWGDDVFIQEGSMEVYEGILKLNASRLRYRRFSRLLQGWSIKDDDGKALQLSERAVSEIDPEVADVVMDELNKILGIN